MLVPSKSVVAILSYTIFAVGKQIKLVIKVRSMKLINHSSTIAFLVLFVLRLDMSMEAVESPH